jgi:hypothetical protein
MPFVNMVFDEPSGNAVWGILSIGKCQGTPAAYLPVTGQGCLNGCGSAKAG